MDQCPGTFSDELLSMVYAHCLDYKSVNQMARWYDRTDLNMMLSLEGLRRGDIDSLKISDIYFEKNSISTASRKTKKSMASPHLTNKVYMNVDPVLRHAVEQLPVGDWL